MMQKQRKFWWLAGILVVLLACTAPSTAKPDESTMPADVAVGTQRPPGPTPAAGEVTPHPPAASAPSQWRFPGSNSTAFRSFRSHMVYTVTLPDEGKQYTLLDMQAEVIPGRATHEVLRQQEDQTPVEIIQIGNQAWMRLGDEPWMMVSSDQIAQAVAAPQDFVHIWQQSKDWQCVGKETASGQEVWHYTLDFSDASRLGNAADWFYSAAASVEALKGASFAVNQAKADVYVLPDGTLLKVYYLIAGEAHTADGQTRAVEMHSAYEIFDVNADIQITPPAEAAHLTEAPFPLPENATAMGGTEGMQVFTIPNTTVSDVIAFLEAHLPEQGFTMSNKMGDASSGYMLIVEGHGATYAVTVAPEGTGVTISIIGK